MIVRYLMGIRQKWINDFISPRKGSCGMLQRIQPSVVYPTSQVSSNKNLYICKNHFDISILNFFFFLQVDLNVRVNVEDVEHVHQKMTKFSSTKINIRGTLDAKAASTNESVLSWDVNVNADMSQGHVVNNVKVQMTRAIPGEKNLKVTTISTCIIEEKLNQIYK